MTNMTKQQLVFEIDHLPTAYVAELQSFIQYLKFKQSSSVHLSAHDLERDPEHDPILHAIGVIEEAPFSEIVDEALYATL